LGIAGKDADHPDWLLTVSRGEDAFEFKADTLDLLQAMLIAH
jgi:hypothetical protein